MVDTYAERSELGWTKRKAFGGRGKLYLTELTLIGKPYHRTRGYRRSDSHVRDYSSLFMEKGVPPTTSVLISCFAAEPDSFSPGRWVMGPV